MRIGGKELVKTNTKRVQLRRGDDTFDITLCPLPPGWYERMRVIGVMDYPTAPKKVVMNGERPVKDRATGRLLMDEDENDPKYRAAFRQVSDRVQALKLAAMLREDTSIEFSVQAPTGTVRDEWLAYADALRQELCDPKTGFTELEMAEFVGHAEGLESVIDLDEAVNDFLPEN